MTTRRDGMYAHGPGSGYETEAQGRARIASRRTERIDSEIAARAELRQRILRARAFASGALRDPSMAATDAEYIRALETDLERICRLSPESTIDAEDADRSESADGRRRIL